VVVCGGLIMAVMVMAAAVEAVSRCCDDRYWPLATHVLIPNFKFEAHNLHDVGFLFVKGWEIVFKIDW
jgi:hypothetical protein